MPNLPFYSCCMLRCLLAFSVFSTVTACACSVPVFRYALEHWPADLYQAVIFHRGALAEADQALVGRLSPEGRVGKLHANLSVLTINLDNAKAEELEFWQRLGANNTPWLVLRYPANQRLPANAWSAALTSSAVEQVLESPARQQIAQRLGAGQSAVWVLLEIGDKQKDDAAAQLLEERLKYLAGVLELPQLERQDIVNGLISVGQDDLKLEFSTLRVSRTDPAEQAFAKMLLGTEADLEELSEPIVFPVFGRGRALYALIGKGINHETIDEAASFLIGRCSCQVKELNPGVDLLFSADWETLLKPKTTLAVDQAKAGPIVKQSDIAPETVTISGAEEAGPINQPQPEHTSTKSFLAIGLAAIGLITAAIFFFTRK